jgi:hypothetical protein
VPRRKSIIVAPESGVELEDPEEGGSDGSGEGPEGGEGDGGSEAGDNGAQEGLAVAGAAPRRVARRAAGPAAVELDDDVDDASVDEQLGASVDGLSALAGVSDAYLRVKRLAPAEYGGQRLLGFVPNFRIEPPFSEEKIATSIEALCGGGTYQLCVMRGGHITGAFSCKIAGPPKLLPDPNVKPEPVALPAAPASSSFVQQYQEVMAVMGLSAPNAAGAERMAELKADLTDARRRADDASAKVAELQAGKQAADYEARRLTDRLKDAEDRLTRAERDLSEARRAHDADDREIRKLEAEVAGLRADSGRKREDPIEAAMKLMAVMRQDDPSRDIGKAYAGMIDEMVPRMVQMAMATGGGGGDGDGGGKRGALSDIREIASAVKEVLGARATHVRSQQPPREREPAPAAITGPRHIPGSASPVDSAPQPAPVARHIPGTATPVESAAPAPVPQPPAAPAGAAPVTQPPATGLIHPQAMDMIRQQIQANLGGAGFARWLEDHDPEAKIVSSLLIDAIIDNDPESVYGFAVGNCNPADAAILGSPAGKKWFVSFCDYIRTSAADEGEGDAPDDKDGESA